VPPVQAQLSLPTNQTRGAKHEHTIKAADIGSATKGKPAAQRKEAVRQGEEGRTGAEAEGAVMTKPSAITQAQFAELVAIVYDLATAVEKPGSYTSSGTTYGAGRDVRLRCENLVEALRLSGAAMEQVSAEAER
jgi:hypothetical protein